MDPISHLEISTHKIESDTFTIMKRKQKQKTSEGCRIPTERPRQEGKQQLPGVKGLREGMPRVLVEGADL